MPLQNFNSEMKNIFIIEQVQVRHCMYELHANVFLNAIIDQGKKELHVIEFYIRGWFIFCGN